MRRFSLLAVVALLVAACTQEIVVESVPTIADEAPETITLSFEEDTRIQLNEMQKTVWTNGDQVSVFYRSDANQKWEYNGPTGSRTADIYRVEAGQHTQKLHKVVVVYPYNENYYINPETCDIQAFMPAEQTYMKDSYGLDGNIMISAGYYNQFSLKNVCGWLKVQLEGNGEMIKSITLRGNNGEQVAGEIYINSADASSALASEMGEITDEGDGMAGGAGGNLVFEDTVIKEVTLDCGNGVELGAEATAFYIALPPQTFANGLTITVTAVDGTEMIKSTSNEIVIERNHIQPMAALEYDGIPDNEIWYTSTDDSVVEPNATNVFGANILSNTYENGKGVIVFDGPVTLIGYEAFYAYETDCEKLTSVTIPNSVTKIRTRAFYSCDNLRAVNIPNSVTEIERQAFNCCKNLKSINLPNSLTTIGNEAFEGCEALTTVTIPDSVTSVGTSVFENCDSLKEFKGKFAEDNGRCLIVDGKLVAFAIDCGVTEYVVPDIVSTICSFSICECQTLTSITIPDSVVEIEDYGVYNCKKLSNVTLGNNVVTIGDAAFAFSKITTITIPDSVTTFYDGNPFLACDDLKEFKGKFATEDGRALINGDTILAYANASGSVYNIPNNITIIGDEAFKGCKSLTNVDIPDSVTTIGDHAFYGCSVLTSVDIPNSVATIKHSAFESCSKLKYVYCKPTTPPVLGSSYVFYNNAAGRKIYVPAESVDAYRGAQYWSEYASMIEPDPMVYTVLGSYNPDKYITYVQDYDYSGYGDAFDYNVYYYGTTIYSDGLYHSSKVECKFSLNDFSSGAFYISVGEYDDDIYDIYININGLNIGDELYSWTDMGVSKTDVITLTLSGTTMIVNGKTISGIPSVGRYLDGYIWSGHYHERDDGMWWNDYTFQDGAKIYYAKGWDSDGDLIYLGVASLSADGRACWKSTYSDYSTGNIMTEEHFPRVTSSFGRGNL